jgi:hypothetical protein
MSEVTTRPSLYEQDFVAWTQEQAKLLRQAASRRLNAPFDLENLAEEIESLGISEKRGLASEVTRIIEHLLKLQYSPAAEPRSVWRHAVRLHRSEAARILELSPSLWNYAQNEFEGWYHDGHDLAAEGMQGEVDMSYLPAGLPYDLQQVLDRDWWPSPIVAGLAEKEDRSPPSEPDA